jgi:transformation/transcription domain-associated protein
MDKIFDPRLSKLDKTNFNIDNIHTVTDRIMPRGKNSFKVLQELPIVLVLLYQLYKQNVHDHVVVFLPAILNTITLEPKKEFREMENFNKEMFVDFISVQIKTLAFLAYTIKTFPGGLMEIIEQHANILVCGMILLLRICPKEVAHLRKELLVATRHILATNLRNHFIPSTELLFDEDLLLGKSGYTALCSLRPLAFSTLGDFIHHVRSELNLDILSKAIHLFSKNIHDETLPIAIQIMSIRLLLNLVDCIRNQKPMQGSNQFANKLERKELLNKMLKVFILKFHTIGKIQMPKIIENWKEFCGDNQTETNAGTEIQTKEFTSIEIIPNSISKLTSIGFAPPLTLNISEYRLLVKSLIGGIKTIIYGVNFIENDGMQSPQQNILIHLNPQDIQNFIDFFNWSLDAFYIYRINNGSKVATSSITQREEKELLELFSGLFLNLSSQNFQAIFSITIDVLIDKMLANQNLQIIINTFLSYRSTSPLFASVMVEFLLDRMHIIGTSNIELSNLYLKMFKLIFGSVSMFANENETMIRPYLQKIVINSMSMATKAEEPYNYFLLLRALFRSIGGGTYDILYQEFLPLLPNLLGGLNRLQNGYHKQLMKDLFVELCLTVPVRLSSLLPYLPMLMDPLVSALNGSPTLVTQGLRTLELCVDNLLPDFFYDHIQPVRAELMQSLWKTLRNLDSSAVVAFRILGKFGGGNRNICEAQAIEFVTNDTETVLLAFSYSKKVIFINAEPAVKMAYEVQKSSTDKFYLLESWNVVKNFFISIIHVADEEGTLRQVLGNYSQTNDGGSVGVVVENSNSYETKFNIFSVASCVMFLAASNKEIDREVLPFMAFIVERYTMIALYDTNSNYLMCQIIHGLFSTLECDEKHIHDFCSTVLHMIIKLSIIITGSLDIASKHSIMKIILNNALNLLYKRSTYCKKGGCMIIKLLCENMPEKWILENIFRIIKAHIFIIRDLSDSIDIGTTQFAKSNIEYIIQKVLNYLNNPNNVHNVDDHDRKNFGENF